MLPINNSDTAWLIVSDYNQENDKHFDELREDILDPTTNIWSYEYYAGIAGERVGGESDYVGGNGNAGLVGRIMGISGRVNVGGTGNSIFVGGHYHYGDL